MEDNLLKVYNGLKRKNPNLPDYDRFKSDMKDNGNLRLVYDGLKNKNPDLPEFGVFSFDMGLSSIGSDSLKTENDTGISDKKNDAKIQVNSLYDDVNKELDGAYSEYNTKEREYSRKHPLLSALSGMREARTGGASSMPLIKDKKIANLSAAKNFIEDSRKVISAAEKENDGNFLSGVGRGIKDNLFDIDTWSMGITDGVYNSALDSAADRADKGEELTSDEQKLLDAAAVNMATNAYFASDLGRGYKAGGVAAESIPFMLEMLINPAASAGKGVGSSVLRYGLKRFGKETMKSGAGKVARVGARVAGDFGGAMAMTATTGLGGAGADAVARHSGEVQFTEGENGVEYAGREGGEDWRTAAMKAFGSRTIENYSEMFGHYFSPVGKALGKTGVAKSLSATKVGKMIENVKTSDIGKAMRDFENATQWNGTLGEYGEEVAGTIMNALTVGDSQLSDVTDLDQQIDTFLGVSLMGGFLSGAKAVGYRTPKYSARKKLEKADGMASDLLGGNWEDVRQSVDDATEGTRKDVLTGILMSEELTLDQKRAVMDYVSSYTTYNGIITANSKQAEEGERTDVDVKLENSYEEGHEITDTPAKRAAKVDYEIVSKRFDEERLNELNDIDRPGEYILAHEEEADDLIHFFNTKARYDGMIQQIRDDIDSKVQVASKFIDDNTHSDGMMYSAVLKDENKTPVYVVSGGVALNEGGEVDRDKSDARVIVNNEGRLEMRSIKDIGEVSSIDDSAQMKSITLDDIRRQIAMRAEEEINTPLEENNPTVVAPGDELLLRVGEGDVGAVVQQRTPDNTWIVQFESPVTIGDVTGRVIELSTKQLNELRNQKVQPESEEVVDGEELKLEDTTPVYPVTKDGKPDYNLMLEQDPNLFAEAWEKRSDPEKAKITLERQSGNIGKKIEGLTGRLERETDLNKVGDIEDEISALEGKKKRIDEVIFSRYGKERPKQTPDALSEPEYYDWVTRESDDVNEVMEAYGQLKEIKNPYNNLQEWQRQLLGKKVKADSYYQFGDRNNVTQSIKTKWFSKEGQPLDVLAKELSEFGKEVTEQDIVEFITGNPSNSVSNTSPEVDALGQRFSELASRVAGMKIGRPDSPTGKLFMDLQKSKGASVSDEALRAMEEKLKAYEQMQPPVTTLEEAIPVEGENEGVNVEDLEAYEREVENVNNDNNSLPGDDNSLPLQSTKLENNEVSESIPQGEFGTLSEEDSGIEETLIELRRRGEENARNAQETGRALPGREQKEIEDRIAEQYAKDKGIWIPMQDVFSLGDPAPSGNENDVYLSLKDNSVFKVNNLMNSGSISSLLERIKFHNYYFPQTKYKLVGFSGFGNRDVFPVLKQDYVPNSTFATPEEIDNYMQSLGLKQTGRAEYSNGDVTISDLYPRNVLKDADGDIYVVDAEFKEKTVSDNINDQEIVVNTSPSEAQKEAGNYKKGHVKLNGFDVTIEQPKGSVRSGVDENGKEWSVTMNNTYGYIRGTKGKDGDHIDIFVGTNPKSKSVFVVDQVNKDGVFDEHKVMMGFDTAEDAQSAYLSNYEEGWQGLGNITRIELNDFKKWVDSSTRKLKPFSDYKRVREVENNETNSYLSGEENIAGNGREDQTSGGHSKGGGGVPGESGKPGRAEVYQRVSQGTDGGLHEVPGILGEASEVVRGEKEATGDIEPAEGYKGGQTKALKELAEKRGVWVSDHSSLGDFLDKGGENEVYSRDDKFVYKLNNFEYAGDDLVNFFDRIQAHNELFPNAPYKLIGFSNNNNGEFAAVLEQPYIDASREATEEEISSYMREIGFEDDGDGDFHNDKYEVFDAVPNNVLVGTDGQLYFIDTQIVKSKVSEEDGDFRFRDVDISLEEQSIIDKAKDDGTYLKAPNGKSSNLNEKQWVQVRTKVFKDWFGDWENDAANSSKVVDENGEPMVVYHGSKSREQFSIFSYGDYNGNFFTSSYELAKDYASDVLGVRPIYPVFLNIRNPKVIDANGGAWGNIVNKKYNPIDRAFTSLRNGKFDGIIEHDIIDAYDPSKINSALISDAFITMNRSAIKSASDNNGDFDKYNDDIRFMKSDKNNTEQVNDRFNDELQQQIDGKLPKGHVYQLGKPSSALRSAGIPDLPIELSASKLEMKSSSDYESNHPFELRTVENLPEAIANPIAVFDSKTKFGHKVILTELKSDGNNFVVAMQINSHPKGFQKNIEVNSIRSVYPKDNVKDVINWINRGDLLRYMHKDKILTWVTQQQSNSADVAIPNKDFDIATNIIENFKNPTILDGEISSGIDRMSDELGVEVKKVKDRGELPEGIQRKMKNGRYPGLYDVNTGEVYLVMNEITSVEDAQATMLHEVLGHKGIHGLFGERLPEFCNRVLDSIEEGKREKLLKEYDGNKQLAAEEHVASFAEGYSDPSAWEKVKAIVRNFFRKMGIDLKLSDNDLKYVLWKAKNGVKGDEMVMDVAGKVTRDKDVQGILFRNDANEEVNEENVKVKQVAQEIYEAGTISMMTGRFWNSEFWTKENREGFKNDLGESWHDYMRSLKILQDAVSKEDGKEVKDFENAYLLENHTSSINKVEWDSMMDKLVNPLSETISEIVSKNKINNREMQLDDVEIYLNCVHGMERNEKFAKRDAEATLASRESELAKLLDAKEIDQDEHDKKLQAARENLNKSYLKNRKRDYSGLTGIFDKDGKDNLSNEDLEERAKEYIKQFENIAGKDSCEKLWGEVKAMNDFSLRKSYLCGLLSKRQYEETRGMFDHYVPLRGFDEAVASEVYHYITREDIPLEKTVKKSWGRKSKAGNIIATMMNMGHSAIIMGNKNMVKERFLNFALNHPTSLLSVSEQWYEESADGTDVPVYPVLNDDMTSEQQRDAIEDFDTRMKELEKEGKVKRARGGLKLNLQAEKWQKEEHHVRVREHGREYLVWVNGNPKSAQAVNGLLNVDANENLLLKIPNSLNRFVSKNVTSRNPEFLVSNLARDIQTSAMSSSVKYGKAYSVKFLKNLHNNISFAAVKGVRKGRYNGIYRLYYRYKKGELNMNDPRERLFSEFIENGGETGYSNLWNIDDYEKQIKKIVKRANTKAGRVAAGIEAVGNGIEFANRGIENACRFAAYMTSRETGKSILQSIADAKEVSVNFNRKGSGKLGNELAKSWFMFLNPSVQGLMKQLELTRSYPKKMLPLMGGVIGLGFASSFANALVASLFGGDDDDDDKYNYYKLSEWKRRNNICVWAGNDGFVTIPLSPEIRAFYGLGEIAAGVVTGYNNHENTGVAIASQLSQLIPVDIVDAKGLVSPDGSVLKGVLKGVTPTSLSYITNAYGWNEDYVGRKVTNQEDWNNLEPEWKRVPKNTFTWLVESSKWLNERTGGNEHLKSKLDSPVMNPAAVEYLMSSYLGGVATFALKCWKTGQAILGNEDMQDARNYPVVSRLFSGVDNDYSKERRMNNAYKYYESEYEITNKQVKGFEGDMDRGITDHADLIYNLYTTGEYRRWRIFDEYKPDMSALNRELKEARKEGNANEAESLMKDIYGLRREMVKRLEEVK